MYRNYEAIAPYYDRQLVDECGYSTPARMARALSALGPRAAGLFLDLGAGTGLVGRASAAAGLPIAFVAMDRSEAMLAAIDPQTAPAYVDRRCADVLGDLPFARAEFDGAVAAGLLEHIVDPAPFFVRVHRVLKPGAPFLFTFPPASGSEVEVYDPGAAALAHPREAIERALDAAGYSIRASDEEPAYRDGNGFVSHVLVVADASH